MLWIPWRWSIWPYCRIKINYSKISVACFFLGIFNVLDNIINTPTRGDNTFYVWDKKYLTFNQTLGEKKTSNFYIAKLNMNTQLIYTNVKRKLEIIKASKSKMFNSYLHSLQTTYAQLNAKCVHCSYMTKIR